MLVHSKPAGIHVAIRRSGLALASVLALATAALAGMVAFGTAQPPRLSLGDPIQTMDLNELPPIEFYQARDGAQLAFRTYAVPDQKSVAVLIHGAAYASESMHTVARALVAAGVSTYSLDLRGHGSNHPRGQIKYEGQLDDDLEDFVALFRPWHAGTTWTLIGFSMGGGFALRVDGGPAGGMFDRYVLLAPALRYDAPTVRQPGHGLPGKPDLESFTAPYIPRLIGLTVLDHLGVHHWDDLPVLAFAPPEESSRLAGWYSMRLLSNVNPRENYLGDIRNIHKPTSVIVGAQDEFAVAEKFAPLFHALRPEVGVSVLPGLDHFDLITHPTALKLLCEEVLR